MLAELEDERDAKLAALEAQLVAELNQSAEAKELLELQVCAELT